jgi:GxxExxY protein
MKHEILTQQLIGLFYDVYNELGHGFLESVYQKSYALVLRQAKLRFDEQLPVRVNFRGLDVGDFRADILVESTVIIELKAVQFLESAHERQLMNYLRATSFEVGLLFNFGPKAQVRRLIFDNERKTMGASASSSPSV